MILNIVLATSVFLFSLGESLNSGVSSMSLYRGDVSLSDDFNTMYFYDKDFKKYSNSYQKDDLIHLQRQRNIQYAPLVSNPLDEMSKSTYHTETTESEIEDLPETEITTRKTIEPQFDRQYNVISDENRQAEPKQQFGGHNIKMVTKNELTPEFGNNYDYSDRNAHINVRSNTRQSYSNGKVSEQRQRYPNNPPKTELYAVQNPLKHIKQGLSSSENGKVQSLVNPYYVKPPRLHLNIAPGHQIALAQNKAPENGHLLLLNSKRIHLNKHKHKYVPNIDVLLQKKTFLYPTKNTL